MLFNGQKHLRSVAKNLVSNKQKRTERTYQKRLRHGHYDTLKQYFSTGHNFDFYSACENNKKLCRAFNQQTNGLTLNIPVLQGLLRVNGKAEKDA